MGKRFLSRLGDRIVLMTIERVSESQNAAFEMFPTFVFCLLVP